MPFADLHLHSHFSDGTCQPEELAALGGKHHFAALSLTDHDSVEGCDRMETACHALGIEFITGAELTAEAQGYEVHIIGYFVDTRQPKLLAEIAKFQKARQERIHEIAARLRKLNVPLEAEAVFQLANCRSPGRPHVGRALVKAGLCSSMDEAFERFLKHHRPAFVPKYKMSARQAMDLIHEAGGLAVMAHPVLNRSDAFFPELLEAGLDGIECYHSKQTASDTRRYIQMADRYHLLVTGGSDCHGMSKGKPLMGGVKLPYEYIEKMKEKKATVASGNRQAN